MKPSVFPTKIDLPLDVRNKLVDLLNRQLAALTDLRMQTKHAHWNVKGPHFYSLHLLFDTLAESLDDPIDEVAERATSLGGLAQGTAQQVARQSYLPEFPATNYDGLAVVVALVERWAAAAKATREAIDIANNLGDADTADLLTGISRNLDKHLWFLEAHLQGGQI